MEYCGGGGTVETVELRKMQKNIKKAEYCGTGGGTVDNGSIDGLLKIYMHDAGLCLVTETLAVHAI